MTQTQDTSLEAYQNAPLALRQQQVYEFFVRHPNRNWTNMEVASHLRWSINRVTPRVLELREKGLLILATRRLCNITHNWAYAWAVK